MSQSVSIRPAALGVALLLGLACVLPAGCAQAHPRGHTLGRAAPMSAELAAAPDSSAYDGAVAGERQVIRSGYQVLVVDDPTSAAQQARDYVIQRGGWIESTSTPADGAATLNCRVPSERLDEVMQQLATLGDVKERSLNAVDVTDQLADTEALLENKLALRGRFRALLERADSVTETLNVEKELARLQSEIDSLQGRLERTRSQVADSALTLRLERRRVLGPLGWVGHWIWWGVSKLFVLSD